MFSLNEQQTLQLAELGRRRRLKFIILHGSYATGRTHPHSDLDVAVLGKSEITRDELLDLYAEIAEVLGDLPERELDLKTLHRKDPLFLYQVMKDSRLLFGNPTEYHEFKAYAFRQFHDSRDLRRLERILTYRLLERIKQDA